MLPSERVTVPSVPGTDAVGVPVVVRGLQMALQAPVQRIAFYTFTPDRPGMVAGDNIHDAFGAQKFTWHVVRQVGAATPAPVQGSGSSGGGGSHY